MKKMLIALSLILLACVSTPSVSAAPQLSVPSDLTTKEVSFKGDGNDTFFGTIIEPKAARPNRPGLVLIHGSGSGSPREKLLPEATGFAQQGMSVLIYDKRSKGYSGVKRSYVQLSHDALGAVGALRGHPGVDRTKVGVWGISEGGWIAPLAASQSKDVAFVIVTGANAMVPVRQQAWSDTSALRRNGVSGSLTDRAAPKMFSFLADVGLFAEARYDAAAVLRKLDQPILAIWGTNDLSTPPGENPPLFQKALEQGNNPHYTLRFFQGADHAAHETPDGGVTRLPILAPGYAQLVGSWVNNVTSGHLPLADAAPAPQQPWQSIPISHPAWWEDSKVQLTIVALCIGVFSGYLLTRLTRRLRHRPRYVIGGRWPLLLAGAGAFTTIATSVYLLFVFNDGAKGIVILGRPLPWIILKALALTIVVAAILVVRALCKSGSTARSERIWLILLSGAAGLFTVWALYWGLLLP